MLRVHGKVPATHTSATTFEGLVTMEAGLTCDGGATFNDTGADVDFRIESDTNANCFVIDGAKGQYGLNTAINGSIQYYVAGSFTGASDTRGFFVGPSLTVNSGETCEAFTVSPTIITHGSGTHGNLYGLKVGALNVTDTGATITNASSAYIDGAPTEATNNYALWVNDGAVRFDSATFAIREITYTWPPDNGDAGEQLQTNGSGTLTWEAAGSSRSLKEKIKEAKPADALKRICQSKVYDFNYKEIENKNKDTETRYTGVMAEEAPWAMHYNGKIFNSISAFGNAALAIQALTEKLDELTNRIGELESA
mgnify:CR=1 FL=1|jgi:hypothetical protein